MAAAEPHKILVVEDEELMRSILRQLLEDEGFDVTTADSAESALDAFAGRDYSVILTDIKMSGIDGIELLDRIKSIEENALVIIMTAYSSVDSAISALRKGAYDYVTKPFVNEDLIKTIKNAIRTRELFNENRFLRRELDKRSGFSEIVGNSDALNDVFRIIEKVAASNATVLIQGESGTGKELVARAVQQKSGRSDQPFVAVNCGAIPETLLESELFGHRKGAFTGASSDKPGLFLNADGGTMFLDEIGELPSNLQVKLLRTLQEKEVMPVGAESPVQFDARIIAATNKNLAGEVKERRFREDLFYRLNVVEIHVPPLRERREDIPLLAKHFSARNAADQGTIEKGFSAEAMQILLSYGWRGNVRELENAIARAFILSEDQIDAEDLPAHIRASVEENGLLSEDAGVRPSLEEVERRYIVDVLASVSGDKTTAARILGIDLSTLYRKLKKYNKI